MLSKFEAEKVLAIYYEMDRVSEILDLLDDLENNVDYPSYRNSELGILMPTCDSVPQQVITRIERKESLNKMLVRSLNQKEATQKALESLSKHDRDLLRDNYQNNFRLDRIKYKQYMNALKRFYNLYSIIEAKRKSKVIAKFKLESLIRQGLENSTRALDLKSILV